MKHPLPETIALYGWFVIGSVLSAMAVFLFDGRETLLSNASGGWPVLYIIGLILAGAAVMIFMLTRIKDKEKMAKTLLYLTSFVFGISAATFIRQLLGGSTPAWGVVALVAISVMTVGFCYYNHYLGIRKRGEFERWQEVTSNVVMISITSFAAGSLGQMLSPMWAIILLGLVGIYDAIAVWKLKSMQKMANGLIELGMLPALVTKKKEVPKGKKFGIAMIGNGDVLFVGMVGGIFLKHTAIGWYVFGGMLLSVLLLLFASREGRYYPAIPFILAGACGGLIMSVAFT